MGLFQVLRPGLMVASGLAAGLNKGFITQKRTLAKRPVSRKGKLGRRVKFVREVVREVAGYAPYEKRIMELLKVGKNRRGAHQRAKKKREDMSMALKKIQAQQKAAGAEDTQQKGKKGKK